MPQADPAKTNTGTAKNRHQRRGMRLFYVPLPDNGTDCGLPPPLSGTERVALRTPTADGVKVTPIVPLAPGPRLGQLLLCTAKAPAFVPIIGTLRIVMVPRAATLVSVRVSTTQGVRT